MPDPAITALAHPLDGPATLDPLLDRVADARIVCIGEASHGTHEYYAWRAELTKRLIAEHGFGFVAVEGDWPDCFRVTCAVTGSSGEAPRQALTAFERWPTWMWANEEVTEFAEWLAGHNAGLPAADRAGFYGLDVYSLWESLRGVIGYLQQHQPQEVASALAAFNCFLPYGEDAQDYARATRLAPASCEDEVVALLSDVRRAIGPQQARPRDAAFDAEQNALVSQDAERYYRAMVRGGPTSWNVRDTHMADTLDRLLAAHGPDARAVIWEHNTHVGDARYTDMADAGMVNVGQLVRERHGRDDVVLVGFAGFQGSVIAGPSWGAPMERMAVPPARVGSVERLLHQSLDTDTALIVVPDERPAWLAEELDHRAIGVVYHPEGERLGNYVPSVMGDRYDALLWFAETSAVRPLHPVAVERREPETWPWAV